MTKQEFARLKAKDRQVKTFKLKSQYNREKNQLPEAPDYIKDIFENEVPKAEQYQEETMHDVQIDVLKEERLKKQRQFQRKQLRNLYMRKTRKGQVNLNSVIGGILTKLKGRA